MIQNILPAEIWGTMRDSSAVWFTFHTICEQRVGVTEKLLTPAWLYSGELELELLHQQE